MNYWNNIMFSNIGKKIQRVAVVTVWVEIITSIICGIIIFFLGLIWGISDDASYLWYALLAPVTVVLACVMAWLSVIVLYGFGKLIEDVEATRNRLDGNLTVNVNGVTGQTQNANTFGFLDHEAQKRAEREERERAKAEEEERMKRIMDEHEALKAQKRAEYKVQEPIKREVQEPIKREAQEPAKHQEVASGTVKKEKSLAEILTYALKYQTDDGMIRYLKDIDRDEVKEILNRPEHLIREHIESVLDNL